MKILQVSSALFESGGIEKCILLLSEGLRAQGHEVHIGVWPNTWVWRQAQERGIPTVPLRIRKQHDWTALSAYLQVLRRERYDIVHTHYSPDYIVPAMAAKLVHQRGLLLTRHVVLPWKPLKRWMYAEALYPQLIGVSDAVRRILLASGVDPSRVTTVYNGVEERSGVTPAPLRAELGLPPDSVLIGIAARIAKEKGHAVLLEAMRSVDSRAACLIAGKGPEEAALRSYVRAQGLEERVRFLGFRTDSDAVIAGFDILVQPSLWEEACSLAILEGMALGKPVVATQVGGNPELIQAEETGLLVPKGEARALSVALNTLVCDAGLRQRMGEAAIRRQRTLFSVPRMAQDMQRVYLNLLQRQA